MRKLPTWVAALIVFLAAYVVIGGVLMTRAYRAGGTPTNRGAMAFYDEGTRQIYPHFKTSQLPPVEAPSGKEGVRAFVYSCGDCSDRSSHFIAYLQKHTAADKRALAATFSGGDTGARVAVMGRRLIRRVSDTRWVEHASAAGQAIVTAVGQPCAPDPANLCHDYID